MEMEDESNVFIFIEKHSEAIEGLQDKKVCATCFYCVANEYYRDENNQFRNFSNLDEVKFYCSKNIKKKDLSDSFVVTKRHTEVKPSHTCKSWKVGNYYENQDLKEGIEPAKCCCRCVYGNNDYDGLARCRKRKGLEVRQVDYCKLFKPY